MKCLIVAAGQGTRLRGKAELKPLAEVGGITLIERVMQGGLQAGVDGFFIVSGYRGEELRSALDAIALRIGARITHIVNDEWSRANGVSVLKAKPYLDEPFLLTMCDHLVDPAILQNLMAEQPEPGSVVLAVDFAIDDPLNDPLDATRVNCVDGRIERIGKLIDTYNAFDTGIFLCTMGMFDALEESQAAGEDSISGAMTALAAKKRAHVFDIGDKIWLDVDDLVDFDKAERLIEAGQL